MKVSAQSDKITVTVVRFRKNYPLIKDRILDFDNDVPGEYQPHDFYVLERSAEIFEQAVLLKHNATNQCYYWPSIDFLALRSLFVVVIVFSRLSLTLIRSERPRRDDIIQVISWRHVLSSLSLSLFVYASGISMRCLFFFVFASVVPRFLSRSNVTKA